LSILGTLFRLQTQGKLTSEEIEDKMKAELAKTGGLDDDSFGEFSDNDSTSIQHCINAVTAVPVHLIA
jgi:hypothetical protein